MEFSEFSITIDIGSFENPETEIVALLEKVAQKVVDGWEIGAILDTNGNTVGRFEYRPWEGLNTDKGGS